ncbi:MAG: outer membrane protein transport protein [Deltaproteobacteria bacterium]|nr:outer membrane protein transport protein [Deltaproteobacteria bacterium]
MLANKTIKLDGDDFNAGFNLGAHFEPSDKTRLGIIYWSKVDLDFEGDVEIFPAGIQGGVSTNVPLVQFIRAGFYHEFTNKFALLGTIDWENWSDFENQNLSVRAGSNLIPRNWDDTYHFALGIHYRPRKPLLLQTGIAYDTSPVDSIDRTPDMPIDRQIRYAAGVQYQWSEKINIGGVVEFVDMGDAEIINPLLIGEYRNHVCLQYKLEILIPTKWGLV